MACNYCFFNFTGPNLEAAWLDEIEPGRGYPSALLVGHGEFAVPLRVAVDSIAL